MHDYWTILLTALVTFGATYLAHWLTGRPRLVVFSPNSTFFQLKQTQDGSPPLLIRAGQVMVQNLGRKSANRVQLTGEQGVEPWGFNLIPAMDHEVKTNSQGEWILELAYLGPGKLVNLQILNGPNIASVRSLEGPAKAVPVMHQRIFPRWLNLSILIAAITGLVTTVYGVLPAGLVGRFTDLRMWALPYFPRSLRVLWLGKFTSI